MKNDLLKKYYEQTDGDVEVSSYTFYDVYEVAMSSSSGGSSCCGCLILLACCYAISNS